MSEMSSKLSESKKETQVTRRGGVSSGRVPLKDVVADCERRWYAATLQAAKNGDVDMQSLVGQMFCSGYGTAVDLKKGKLWLQKSAFANEDARKLLSSLSGSEAVESTGMCSQTLPSGT